MMYLIVITNYELLITNSDKSDKSVSIHFPNAKTLRHRVYIMNTDCTDLKGFPRLRS